MAEILVVDDDADLRAMVEQCLASSGHNVAGVATWHEGIKRCRFSSVDLVITDLFMPEQDGIQVIQDLRREFPRIAVIAISGNPTSGSTLLQVAENLGVAAVLEKPFEVESLRSTVTQVLEAKKRAPAA